MGGTLWDMAKKKKKKKIKTIVLETVFPGQRNGMSRTL